MTSIEKLGLPYYSLDNICNHLTATELKNYDRALNPKYTLLRVYHLLTTDWKSKFKYLYFTEADQILHIRRMSEVYDAIGR